MPEISVIVPVYKSEQYLRTCIDSILAQTFTDFELILVDDGSPDGSGNICDEYAAKDSRIHVIHKINGGASSARNEGLRNARGNWITFIDSDDYVLDSYLKDLYEPAYDLTVIGHKHIDCKTKICYEKSVKSVQISHLDTNNMSELLQDLGTYWIMFCWGRLFKKEILAHTFDESLCIGEDYLFSAEYICRCRSICLKGVNSYVHFAAADGSLSTTFSVAFLQGIVEVEDKVTQLMENQFAIRYPRKTDEEVTQLFCYGLGNVAANAKLSFEKKYEVFRYIFANKYFVAALNNPDKYFSQASFLYRSVLKLKSPLLLLLALTIVLKLKNAKNQTNTESR